jgi:HNH endonuclease
MRILRIRRQFNGVSVGIEAAHVQWFNFGGPDSLDNGLALCSLHHKLFDVGVHNLDAYHPTLSMLSWQAPLRAACSRTGMRLAPVSAVAALPRSWARKPSRSPASSDRDRSPARSTGARCRAANRTLRIANLLAPPLAPLAVRIHPNRASDLEPPYGIEP